MSVVSLLTVVVLSFQACTSRFTSSILGSGQFASTGQTVVDQVTILPSTQGLFYLGMSTDIPVVNWFSTFNTAPSSINTLGQMQTQHIQLQPGYVPQLTSNTWDFSQTDAIVQPVLPLGNQGAIFQIGGAPSFMMDSDGTTFLDSTYGQFATYSQNIVKYYNTGGFTSGDGNIHVSPSSIPIRWWGIYNEPNYAGMTPAQAVTMYNAVAPAMRAADPNIKLIALELGSGGNTNQLYGSTFVSQVTSPVDAVGIHVYSAQTTSDTDAYLLSTPPAFNESTTNLVWLLQGNANTANAQVWVTECNVNGGSNVYDPRGSNIFFAAWRPYMFSQLGKAGAHVLDEFYFSGGLQYGEVDFVTGQPEISYWVDYWLNHYFPADISSQRLEINETDAADVETLAVRNPEGSVVVMIANHAVADPSDINGSGAPRVISMDISSLGNFSSATQLKIDGTTSPVTGPVETSIPVSGHIQVAFNGYGVAFIHLNQSVPEVNPNELRESWAPQWSSILGVWHLNGIPGAIAANSTLLDGSSMSANASVNGTGAIFTAGKMNQGVSLDGHEAIVIPQQTAPNPCSAMTVSFWIKSTTPDASLQKTDYSSLGWVIQSNGGANGSLNLRVDTSGGANQVFGWNNADNFYDGNWHQIAFTLNNGAFVLYKDGAQDNAGTYAKGAGFCNANQSLYLGNTSHGSFDEMAIWSKALTPQEIQTIYSRQSP